MSANNRKLACQPASDIPGKEMYQVTHIVMRPKFFNFFQAFQENNSVLMKPSVVMHVL